MPVLKYDEANVEYLASGVERRLVYLDKILTAVLDFSNGPQSEPSPMHSHPHEQTTYIADGEILFFLEGQQAELLKAGDLFVVPSNQMHGIQLLTEKVRLIDSFSPAREDFV